MIFLNSLNFDAVILDLDGTLLDSMGVWSQIDVEYLGSHGLEVPEGLQLQIGGKSFYQVALYFQERFGITDSTETIMETWNRMAFRKYSSEISCKPGGVCFLKECENRGIHIAAATSNSRELAETVLQANGVETYFEAIVTGTDIINGKPAPDVYLEAARRLGLAPERCLVFEDTLEGIRAGLSAGMQVIGVDDPHTAKHLPLKKALCRGIIRDFKDIVWEE